MMNDVDRKRENDIGGNTFSYSTDTLTIKDTLNIIMDHIAKADWRYVPIMIVRAYVFFLIKTQNDNKSSKRWYYNYLKRYLSQTLVLCFLMKSYDDQVYKT